MSEAKVLGDQRGCQRRQADGGMVTAETAILLPALALLLAGMLWVIAGVMGELRCLDAARETARVMARGDSAEAAQQLARRLAPAGAAVRISRSGGEVTAEVRAFQPVFGGWVGRLGRLPLHASATVTDEATTGPTTPVSDTSGAAR